MSNRTQLNINVSPELLKSIKQNAIKSGLTITKYVSQLIKCYLSNEDIEESDINARVLAMEKQLETITEYIKKQGQNGTSVKEELIRSKNSSKEKTWNIKNSAEYGQALRNHFTVIAKDKGLTEWDAWAELKSTETLTIKTSEYLKACQGVLSGHITLTPELINECLRVYGDCPARQALEKWSSSKIDPLREMCPPHKH